MWDYSSNNCAESLIHTVLNSLTLSWRRSLSYRNHSIDLQSNSKDWFLYHGDLLHERVKPSCSKNFGKVPGKRLEGGRSNFVVKQQKSTLKLFTQILFENFFLSMQVALFRCQEYIKSSYSLCFHIPEMRCFESKICCEAWFSVFSWSQ